MAVVQSTYSERIGVAEAGQIANTNDFEADTRQVDASDNIPFGRAVSQGATDRGTILGGTLAGFVGVSIKDITLAPVSADSAYLDHYPPRSNMAVLTDGDIWVLTGAAVAANGAVYFNATTGVFGTSGQGPVPGCYYKTSTTGAALAIVGINRSKT